MADDLASDANAHPNADTNQAGYQYANEPVVTLMGGDLFAEFQVWTGSRSTEHGLCSRHELGPRSASTGIPAFNQGDAGTHRPQRGTA